MHNVFISYHHKNDQVYKDALIRMGGSFGVFHDKSVDTGEIPEYLTDQSIREKIRDEYLRDSTVTILLVGVETRQRKHVDWELYSSMFDGIQNKKSGILAINLPSTGCSDGVAAHGEEEKMRIYPEHSSWGTFSGRSEAASTYPYMPDRIVDNLLAPRAQISVVPWNRITPINLEFLIAVTFQDRAKCQYDLSRPMRRRNS